MYSDIVIHMTTKPSHYSIYPYNAATGDHYEGDESDASYDGITVRWAVDKVFTDADGAYESNESFTSNMMSEVDAMTYVEALDDNIGWSVEHDANGRRYRIGR